MSTPFVESSDTFISTFRLEDLTSQFAGNLQAGLNVCYECCDRHAGMNKPALFWESKDGRSATYTFEELQAFSAQFANFLHEQGIGPGDRVAALLPRIPELFVVALGTWRAGAVYQTLFTAFGPKAIEYRLERSGASLVVTDSANRSKPEGISGLPPMMTIVGKSSDKLESDFNFWDEVSRQATTFEPVMRKADDPFMLLFTSGTVGLAKGVAVPLKALPSMMAYMRYGIGLREDDAYWNVADPGWAYGLYYAVVGPLLLGHATTFYDGPFTVESTYHMLEKYHITNLAAAPTAYRLLLAAGSEAAQKIKGQLRVANSAGEPLNPEVMRWFEQHVGCSIYDQYGQTELGMVVCNYHTVQSTRHPGSMGLPLPGYRIGPFEVESCLIEHPAVAESAVVGKPDPERTELVKAFVVLRPGYEPTPELSTELEQFVKQRLSAHAYPREIAFVDSLPKTPSGKIQRFLLRQQER